MTTFSFVVPAFNEEGYIGPCLDAILALDSLADGQVIVVDNASTDATARLVGEHYPGVTLVSESRKGTGWARQAGFAAAHGEYLCYIDADNLVPPDWLAKVRAKLAADPDCVGCTGPYYYREFGVVRNTFMRLVYRLIFVPLNALLNRTRRGGLLFGGNMAVRRAALEQVGGFDTRLTYWGDDTQLARQLRAAGRIRFFMDMVVSSSARRYAKAGFLRTLILYCLNGVSVVLTGKPINRRYDGHR